MGHLPLFAYWGTIELAAVSWRAAVPVFVVLAVLVVAAFVWARKHENARRPRGATGDESG